MAIATCLSPAVAGTFTALAVSLETLPTTRDEGVKLLLRRHRGQDVEAFDDEASRLIARLGGLALAIDQAAAYTDYLQIPLNKFAGFLITYEEQQEKILRYIPAHFWKYEASNP